jgi:hypothetical protein
MDFTGSLLPLPGQQSGAANHLVHRNIVGCWPSCKRLSQIRTGRADQRPSGSGEGVLGNWCTNWDQQLGTRFYTVHLEEAALRPATAESEFIVAISLNPLPGGVFKMVEHDVAGRSLFA